MTFRQYEQDITPLRGRWGQAWAAGMGARKDAFLERARQSVLAGMISRTPSDGLPKLGADAVMPRAPGESDESYRARIGGAFESWSWAGTKYGVVIAVGLLGYGYPTVWTYAELPMDTDTSRWARVRVYFRGLPCWDAGATWDGDDVWDSLRSEDPIEALDPAVVKPQLRQVLRTWVNGRDIVDSVVVGFGGLFWDLDALWDGDDVWDEGDGEAVWQEPAWDEAGATWDDPLLAWEAFC